MGFRQSLDGTGATRSQGAANWLRDPRIRLVLVALVLGFEALACKTAKPSPATDGASKGPRAPASEAPGTASPRDAAVAVAPSSVPVASIAVATPPPPESCRHPDLIADFEHGIPTVCASSGRGGPLVIYYDGTGAVTPGPGNLLDTHRLAQPRGTSRSALRLVGEGHRIYGVGVAFHLASGMTVDVSEHQGVEGYFKAAQPLTIHLKLATRQTMAEAYGGACEPTEDRACNDHHGVERVVGPKWQLVRVPITGLRQLERGVRAPFDPTQVVEFHVRIPKPAGSEPLSFELFVDDVSFY